MILLLRWLRGFFGYIFALNTIILIGAVDYLTSGNIQPLYVLKIMYAIVSGFIFFGMRPIINKLHTKKEPNSAAPLLPKIFTL